MLFKLPTNNLVDIASINLALMNTANTLYHANMQNDNKEQINKCIDNIVELSNRISVIVRTCVDINKC